MEGTWELADEMMEYGAQCDMEDWCWTIWSSWRAGTRVRWIGSWNG